MRSRELIICPQKVKIISKTQKVVDLYRGEQIMCTVPLARSATLTHSSPGILLLKCPNAWIACLSLPCPSFERKMPKHQSVINSKAILQGLPLLGPSTESQGWLLPGWPQEAVREPGRALPAQAELWSQLTASPERRASTKNSDALFAQCHINYVQDYSCIRFLSDAFSSYWHTKFMKRPA